MTAARKLEPVETEERDYAAEMRAVIDAETAGGPYASPVIAEHVVRKLRVTDPDLLDGWLQAQAVNFVRMMINQRDCSARTYARTAINRRAFGDAAKLHEAGTPDAVRPWLSVPFPVEDGTRKRLADLTAADLSFVAERYEDRARENRMTAAFLLALAKKLGAKKTVGDVYTDAALSRMWDSIAGSDT